MTDANETNQGPHVDTKKLEEKVVWPEPETLEEAKSMLQSQEEGFRDRLREKDADKDKLHKHYGKEVIRMATVIADLISEIAQKNAFAKDIGEKYDYIVAAHDALLVRISDLETDRESLVDQCKELLIQAEDKDELIKALEEKVEKNKHTESWQNGRRTLRFKDGTRWVNIDDTGDVPDAFWPQGARDKIEEIETKLLNYTTKYAELSAILCQQSTETLEVGIASGKLISDISTARDKIEAIEEELKASNALNVLLGKFPTTSSIECFPTGRRCMTLQDGTMWAELYETESKSLGQGISAIIESTESSIFHELRKRGIKITTLEEENDTLKTRLVELEQSNKELNEKDETGDLSMKIEKIRATAVRAENMSRALLSVTTVIAGLNQSVKDRLDNLAKAAEK